VFKDGLKLYCSVGEENIPARPDEALKRMLTEKLENAAHAVSRLDTKNSSSKRQATAAPKVSPPKKSRKEKDPTSYIGTRVAKLFDEDGLYFGEITGYEDDEDGNGFWKILYDDNDEEEFDKNDLIKAVELYKKESSLDKRG